MNDEAKWEAKKEPVIIYDKEGIENEAFSKAVEASLSDHTVKAENKLSPV